MKCVIWLYFQKHYIQEVTCTSFMMQCSLSISLDVKTCTYLLLFPTYIPLFSSYLYAWKTIIINYGPFWNMTQTWQVMHHELETTGTLSNSSGVLSCDISRWPVKESAFAAEQPGSRCVKPCCGCRNIINWKYVRKHDINKSDVVYTALSNHA